MKDGIDEAIEALVDIMNEDVSYAMNRHNSKK